MMQMSFVFTKHIEDFLFAGWSSSSVGGVVGVCCFVCVLSIIAEMLTFFLLHLHREVTRHPLDTPPVEEIEERSPLLRPLMIPASLQDFQRRKLKLHLVLTFVHVLHLVVGYILMLAVMTYNAWIGIAVVTGMGVGYYVFGALKYKYMIPHKRKHMLTDPLEHEGGAHTSERDRLLTNYENI